MVINHVLLDLDYGFPDIIERHQLHQFPTFLYTVLGTTQLKLDIIFFQQAKLKLSWAEIAVMSD